MIYDLIKILEWRMDVASPEMIEQVTEDLHHTKQYLVFRKLIEQKRLDKLCELVNIIFAFTESDLRVYTSWGEIRPTKVRLK